MSKIIYLVIKHIKKERMSSLGMDGGISTKSYYNILPKGPVSTKRQDMTYRKLKAKITEANQTL